MQVCTINRKEGKQRENFFYSRDWLLLFFFFFVQRLSIKTRKGMLYIKALLLSYWKSKTTTLCCTHSGKLSKSNWFMWQKLQRLLKCVSHCSSRVGIGGGSKVQQPRKNASKKCSGNHGPLFFPHQYNTLPGFLKRKNHTSPFNIIVFWREKEQLGSKSQTVQNARFVLFC